MTQCALLPRQKPWHIYNPPCRVGYVSYVHEILSEFIARYQQQQYTMGNFNLVSLIWSKILLPSNSLDPTTNTEFVFTSLKTNQIESSTFSDPPIYYVSTVLDVEKLPSSKPTQSFCWHKLGIVPMIYWSIDMESGKLAWKSGK